MLRILKQPYPGIYGKRHKLAIAFGFGLFIFLFLYLLRPMNIDGGDLGPRMTLHLAAYGLICSLIILFNLFVVPALFRAFYKEIGWVVWKEIVIIIWSFFSVGLGNFFYTVWAFDWYLNWRNLFQFQIITVTIGAIPYIILVLIRQNRLLKMNMREAVALNKEVNGLHAINSSPSKNEFISFVAENGKEEIQLESNSILYLAADGNYIEIYYQEGDILKKHLLRSSVKRIEALLQNHSQFYRCHRAYIVNMEKVSKVSGNSQGLRLSFSEGDDMVPVSRSWLKDFKDKMHNYGKGVSL